MWKWILLGCLLTQILVGNIDARKLDIDTIEGDSESMEIPIRSRPRSSKFSIFKKVDDPVFNFVTKLLNTINQSTKMTVSRAKNMYEKRRELENEIDNFLEKLPNFPIPILDDITPVINNSI